MWAASRPPIQAIPCTTGEGSSPASGIPGGAGVEQSSEHRSRPLRGSLCLAVGDNVDANIENKTLDDVVANKAKGAAVVVKDAMDDAKQKLMAAK